MPYNITIRKIEQLTRDVYQFITDKPKNYSFKPGQATELSINKAGYVNEKRPFTFTSHPDDHELEFIIKSYASHNGVTDELSNLKVGDELIIGDAWGAISYEGPGTFIAGGAGITPFIAIFRNLMRQNKIQGNQLIYANKTSEDIILKQNLEAWLENNLDAILSEEDHPDHAHGHIDADYLKQRNIDGSKPIYLCGPPPMMSAVKASLNEIGISTNNLIEEL